jgi:hypothetical protein
VPDAYDPISNLPADARARLDAFSAGLERINVGDLPVYAMRPVEPAHGRAVEVATRVADERRLDSAVEAARERVIGYIQTAYKHSMMRIEGAGLSPNFGPTDDRVLVMRSVADAVTAVVLGDALDDETQEELLGAWGSLLE